VKPSRSEQLPPPHITKLVMPWLSNSVLAPTPGVLAASALMDLAGAPMDWDSVACQGQTARGWKHCSLSSPFRNDSGEALFSQARGAGLDWRRVVPGAAERYWHQLLKADSSTEQNLKLRDLLIFF
jgi:hypothetical protein